MSNTSIEWTDKVWNPITGCSKVSQGCKNCYAETISDRFFATSYPPNTDGSPRKFTDVRCHEDRLEQPLHWRKPSRIFVNSMSDLFHEDVLEGFVFAVFSIMAKCPQHTFQVLTKRPARMLQVLSDWRKCGLTLRSGYGVELPNVWLGISVEDQKTADERIPLLLQTPAAVRWVSYEPALAPVDFTRIKPLSGKIGHQGWIAWLVCGGESGPNARPMHPDWARSVRDQCQMAGVPFFFKQWGHWRPVGGEETPGLRYDDFVFSDGVAMRQSGKKAAGRLLDGCEWNEYPGGS